MRAIRRLVLAGLLLASMLPAVHAHFPSGPKTYCQTAGFRWDLDEHDYAVFAQPIVDRVDAVDMRIGAAFNVAVINGNTEDCDKPHCSSAAECVTNYADGTDFWDGDWEFGIGGAFLPADHHFSTTITVYDDVNGDRVAWYAGVDNNGDGLISPLDSDPAWPDCLLGPFSGTADISSDSAWGEHCWPPWSKLFAGRWIIIPPVEPGYLPPTTGHVNSA